MVPEQIMPWHINPTQGAVIYCVRVCSTYILFVHLGRFIQTDGEAFRLGLNGIDGLCVVSVFGEPIETAGIYKYIVAACTSYSLCGVCVTHELSHWTLSDRRRIDLSLHTPSAAASLDLSPVIKMSTTFLFGSGRHLLCRECVYVYTFISRALHSPRTCAGACAYLPCSAKCSTWDFLASLQCTVYIRGAIGS